MLLSNLIAKNDVVISKQTRGIYIASAKITGVDEADVTVFEPFIKAGIIKASIKSVIRYRGYYNYILIPDIGSIIRLKKIAG